MAFSKTKCSNCLTVLKSVSNIAYCLNCQEETVQIPNIRNFTPHPLNFQMANGSIYQYPSEGVVSVQFNYSLSNLPLPTAVPLPGEVSNLPDPEPETYLFVSAMVRTALPKRKDLISPSTRRENVIRDGKGNIVAITAFDSNY